MKIHERKRHDTYSLKIDASSCNVMDEQNLNKIQVLHLT